MHWTCPLLMSALVALVASELVDKPPSIEEISVAVGDPDAESGKFKLLDKPQDYLVVGSTSASPLIKHRLRCKASNADDIHWEYREQATGSWNTTLPKVIEVKAPVYSTDGTSVTLDIDDGTTSLLTDLSHLNGYYRCVATYTQKGFVAQSAPLRIVIAYVATIATAPVVVPGTARINASFKISCFQDIAKQLVPADAADFVDVNMKWQRRIGSDSFDFPDEYDRALNTSRFKLNHRTGELNYAYVIPEDALPSEESIGSGPAKEASLLCTASIGSQLDIPTATYIKLDLTVANAAINDVEVIYPQTEIVDGRTTVKESDVLECASGENCKVIMIFGGLKAAKGEVRGKDPEGNIVQPNVQTDYSGFEFKATTVAEVRQIYTVELFNPFNPSEVYQVVDVPIKINNYPDLSDTSQFPPSQNVESGTDVVLVCDARYADTAKFFINGQEVKQGSPSYISNVYQKSIHVNNVRRQDSFSVQCVSTSVAGSIYSDSILNVYDAPALTQHPKASNPYYIDEKSNVTVTTFSFNCSITIDSKLSNPDIDSKLDHPEIYWKSNRTDMENIKITSKDNAGVKSVLTNYDQVNGIMTSRLDVEVTLDSQTVIRNTEWSCFMDYKILDDSELHSVNSEPVAFIIIPEHVTKAPQKEFEQLPLVIGAIVGLIFLIALIVLINCYVQKNKGEQYYVGDREEQAGHNPTEEMKQYAFTDYTRPDQNPIKGSRASMNLSDGKPMESDTGSLDEYGADMDASRYNEDGSFIGQYGQNGQHPRNQADV